MELQRAVAVQKLAMEKQAAATVQAKTDDKVAEELKKVVPSNPPAQAVQPNKKKKDGDGVLSHLDLVTLLKVHGGEQSMLSEPKTTLHISGSVRDRQRRCK